MSTPMLSKTYRFRAAVVAAVALLTLATTLSLGDPAKAAPKNTGEMIKIPGGTFDMGSNLSNMADFYPVHKVTVASFELDKNLVTTDAYAACVDAGGCKKMMLEDDVHHLCNRGQPNKGKHPINCVSYANAQQFCKWAGKRLPTEEEWEFAARGTEGRLYPWGNTDPTPDTACFGRDEGNERKGTCEVGAFPKSNTPSGLQDMAGNLMQWTSTEYHVGYKAHHIDDGEDTGIVERGGGSWATPARLGQAFQAFFRHQGGPDATTGSYDEGVRCAR